MASALPDYSIGFTQAEVENILAKQKAELPKVMAAYSESGTQVTKRALDDTHAIIAACQRALQKLAPGTYGKRRKVMQSRVCRI